MGQMCCPPALEPPTPQHLTAKRMLQGLAIGLVPIVILAFASANGSLIFQIFISLFLVFFLFLAWRTFNWCIVLMYMIYSMVLFIQDAIGLAGYIQYSDLFRHNHIVQSLYLLISTIYFIVAIPLSHYVYRLFKSGSAQQFLMQEQRQPDFNQQQRVDERGGINGGDRGRQRQRERNNNANNSNQHFQGQGVRIG